MDMVHAGLPPWETVRRAGVESVRRQKHRAGDDHHLARFPGGESGELCAGVVRAGGDKFVSAGKQAAAASRSSSWQTTRKRPTCAFQGFDSHTAPGNSSFSSSRGISLA